MPLQPSSLESPVIRITFITPDNIEHQSTWHSTWHPKGKEAQAQLRLNLYKALTNHAIQADITITGMSFLGSSVTELGL